ncbi:MAG TPA: hypothetical protein VE986_00500 [Hyphomicrobiales bacterium]|nr:hypothetical protein [Hyphomicrobiales bacterium]
MAVGEASRRLGDYVKRSIIRYVLLSTAGIPFAAAMAFAVLAGFWALNLWTQNPIWSALIMMGILIFLGFLIVLIAFGITRQRTPGVSRTLREPLRVAQSQLPSVEDVGRQIEHAAQQYGPVRVAGAALAGGVLAGFLARRLRYI